MHDISTKWDVGLRQQEQDAALPLQLARARHLDQLRRTGTSAQCELVTGGFRSMIPFLRQRSLGAQELLAVSAQAHSPDAFGIGHEYNAYVVSRGLRMLSLYHVFGIDPGVRDTIIGAEGLPYHFAYGTVQMKVFDRRCVVVEGPEVNGDRSLMLMYDREAVAAALRYVATVRRTAIRAATLREDPEQITHRQRDVAELLASGLRDDEVAVRLGVSLRTVRAEIAALMTALGAPTRFAAGVRYAYGEPTTTSGSDR